MTRKEVEFSAQPQGRSTKTVLALVDLITSFKIIFYTLKMNSFSLSTLLIARNHPILLGIVFVFLNVLCTSLCRAKTLAW